MTETRTPHRPPMQLPPTTAGQALTCVNVNAYTARFSSPAQYEDYACKGQWRRRPHRSCSLRHQ